MYVSSNNIGIKTKYVKQWNKNIKKCEKKLSEIKMLVVKWKNMYECTRCPITVHTKATTTYLYSAARKYREWIDVYVYVHMCSPCLWLCPLLSSVVFFWSDNLFSSFWFCLFSCSFLVFFFNLVADQSLNFW